MLTPMKICDLSFHFTHLKWHFRVFLKELLLNLCSHTSRFYQHDGNETSWRNHKGVRRLWTSFARRLALMKLLQIKLNNLGHKSLNEKWNTTSQLWSIFKTISFLGLSYIIIVLQCGWCSNIKLIFCSYTYLLALPPWLKSMACWTVDKVSLVSEMLNIWDFPKINSK